MKKLWKEFKEFAFKGNVLDLAIGMIIGAAFTNIVKALVDSILMPLLSLITGKVDFNAMTWHVGNSVTTKTIVNADGSTQQILVKGTEIPYGVLLQALFTFVFTALCLFFVLKAINKMMNLRKKEETPAEPPRLCPYCFTEIHKDATRCPHCTSELVKDQK